MRVTASDARGHEESDQEKKEEKRTREAFDKEEIKNKHITKTEKLVCSCIIRIHSFNDCVDFNVENLCFSNKGFFFLFVSLKNKVDINVNYNTIVTIGGCNRD